MNQQKFFKDLLSLNIKKEKKSKLDDDDENVYQIFLISESVLFVLSHPQSQPQNLKLIFLTFSGCCSRELLTGLLQQHHLSWDFYFLCTWLIQPIYCRELSLQNTTIISTINFNSSVFLKFLWSTWRLQLFIQTLCIDRTL